LQKEYHFHAYILTNYLKTVYYVGFTNNLLRRMIEYKNGLGCKFTTRYQLKYLIYFEQTDNVYSALEREKEIKKWSRKKKMELVRNLNSNSDDLSIKLFKDSGVGEREIQGIIQEFRANYKGREDK